MADLPLVSPTKHPLRNPLLDLRQCWKECTKKEKESFDLEPWKESFLGYLTQLCLSGNCTDLQNASRKTDCTCLQDLDLKDEEVDQLFDYLLKYFKMEFQEQRRLILEWKRYAASMKALGSHDGKKHLCFLLPGSWTRRLCKSAIAKLVGKSRHAWSSISKDISPVHGLTLRLADGERPNRSLPKDLTDKLDAYFKNLQQLGAPRATRIVTGF
jgi:hypothetical protein